MSSGKQGKKAKSNKSKSLKSAQEVQLESFLFGDAASLEADAHFGSELAPSLAASYGGDNDHENADAEVEEAPAFGFSIDVVGDKRKARADHGDEDDQDDEDSAVSNRGASAAAAPAWQDEDDGAVSVNVAQTSRLRKLRVAESETTLSGSELTTRLRARHESMNANAEWAKLASATATTAFGDDDDVAAAAGDSAFLSSNASLLGVSSGRLPQGQLQITRMKDANHADVAQSCVTSVKFHNNGQLMLASGLDRTLRLFQVDGVRNPKVQSVFFDDMPIAAAQFTPDGQDIILAGRRKFFYSYDVVAGAITKVPFIKGREEKSWESMIVSPANDYIAFLGQDGHTVLVSRTTKQWLHNFKMNGSVRTAAFSGDGRQLYTAGDDGQVYLWDVRNLKCAHRFVDEGCIHSTALAVSPSNGHLAAGSNSGVVNLYGADQARTSAAPQPQRALMNLTTRVDMLEFNHDSQILAMASKRNKDALKLVHVPSKTVFANWPTSTTPLSYVQCLAFSPHSGYLAIGNDKGKVLLYRLNHFTSA